LVQSPEKKSSGEIPKPAAAFILIFCLFANLGAIGLVGPDEPRYVWIARAMAATGDWVTPRLYGQPWFEKPVLYYWAAGIGFLLHLPAEWAARLPSAFAALAAALAIGWLASKHYGRQAGLAGNPALSAPLLFATTVGAIGFARAATPDMLFSAFLTMAMASSATVLRGNGLLSVRSAEPATKSDLLSLILFGAFLGLAVLAKGPAAIILTGGAVLLWALVTKRWRSALRLAHPYVIAIFCLVALPWYVLCALRNPSFLRVFIFEHNFERYLTPVFQHPQPFWFFVPITLAALLPWAALLWPAGQEGLRLWRAKSWHDSPGLFFACWAVFPVLFFSFSQSKLPGYILPSVPPLALICAGALYDLNIASRVHRNALKVLGAATAATSLGLGICALVWMHRLSMTEHGAVRNSILTAAIVAIVGAVVIALGSLRGDAQFVVVSLVVVTLLVGIAGFAILPRLDPFMSARWHARLLHSDRHPDRIFAYHLPRSWTYGLTFYFGRELPEWSPSDPNPALVLTTPTGLSEIRKLHRFYGNLEEGYQGILYVPIGPEPR
jgi:4-amino-4-deoxy-L-arabinose transferase-like glycosyltransferase